MSVYHRCRITFPDGIHDDIDQGFVSVLGESPNATVRLAAPNDMRRRFDTVDTLTSAKITDGRNGLTVSGRSVHLATTVGTNEATLVVTVVPDAECEDCKK
jgi:hypothetical protein